MKSYFQILVVLLTIISWGTNVCAQVPKADLLDIVFNDDGSASDVSPLQNEVMTMGTPIIVKSPMYDMNVLCANQNEWGSSPTNYYRIDLTDALLQGISDGVSFETLVRPHWKGQSMPGSWVSAFGMEQGGGFGMIIENGSWRFEFRVGDKYEVAEFPDAPVKDQWIHLVGVWDKDNGTLSLYVDGSLMTVNPNASGEFGLPSEESRWFGIGTDPNGSESSAAFQGDIAFSRLYNNPLNADQVAALYDDIQTKNTGIEEHNEISKIDDEGYYLLGSIEDWKEFVAAASEGTTLDKYRLSADIEGLTIEDMCPSFGGTFDGQGFSLILNMETEDDNCAPFAVLTEGAVIENLWTKGVVSSSNRYVAGIASQVYGATFLNCVSTVEISNTYDGEGIIGGLVGMEWKGSIFQNCVFTGSIDASNAYSVSGFVGKESSTASSTFQNCLANGDGLLAKDIQGKNSYFVCSESGEDTYINNFFTENYMFEIPTSGTNTKISVEQMASGETCWLLNGNQEELAFYQNLGEGEDADAFPVPFASHKRVYASEVNCGYKPVQNSTYSNELLETIVGEHQYVDSFCTICGLMDPDFEGDTPEHDGDIYQITTARELYWFAHQVSIKGNTAIKGLLKNDIDMTGFTWLRIGFTPEKNSFWGTFDGGGHAISGVSITATLEGDWQYAGVFGAVTHGTVKNLTVNGTINCKATGTCSMAGVIARAWDAKVSNVHSNLKINVKGSGFFGIGGVAGFAHDESYFDDCSFNGLITCSSGDSYGGIVGNAWGIQINNCASYGRFQVSNNARCGGILGYADNAGIMVSNSLSVSSFSGDGRIGSLVADVSNINFEKSINNYWLEGNAECASRSENLATSCISVTTDDLTCGKITYALNQGQEDLHWYQTLGEDTYPVLDNTHKKVSLTDEGSYINKGELDPNGIEPTLVDGYYQIKNVENMLWFTKAVANGQSGINAVLIADIDMSDVKEWQPIGICPEHDSFQGVFDGQGHTVKGCNITTLMGDWGCGGLFGCVVRGTVKNLTVKGSLECNGGGCSMFGVIGRAWGATISQVHSALDINLPGSGYFGVGGIVGYAHDNTLVSECSYSGTLSANNSTDVIGGIMGRTAATTIVNCANYGTLSSKNGNCYLGGILGWGGESSFGGMQNCVNIGSVKCFAEEGGNVGALAATLETVIENKCINNYWLSGTADRAANIEMTQAKTVTADEVSNGALCFYLNQGQEDNHWFQNLGTDKYPLLDNTHNKVIMGGNGGYINPGSINPLGVEPELVDGVYQIQTLENLIWFSVTVNNGNGGIKGALTADIDMAPFDGWTPIGVDNGHMFSGVFDGQGHTLSGFHYTLNEGEYGGLFGVACWGSIQNFTLKGTLMDSTISTDFSYAGVIARCWGASAYNIHSLLNITSTINNFHGIGGVVGYIHDGGKVENCSFAGSISLGNTSSAVGGVLGRVVVASMNNCANYGSISFEGANCEAGGILGYGRESAFEGMSNCVNCGSIVSSSEEIPTRCGALVACLSDEANSLSKNNYWLEGTAPVACTSDMANAIMVDEKTMASGEVAYKLNEGQEIMQWYQRIGSDKYPYLDEDHGVVLKTDEGYQNEGINPNGVEPEMVDGIYQIRNAENLLWFSLAVNSSSAASNKAVLTKNIDLSPIESWTPIGVCPEHDSFQGEFDGQGHTVSNLNVTARFGDWACVGLFGCVVRGTVKNLTVEGKLNCVNGACGMYGAIGRAWSAKVSNVHSSLEIEPQEGDYFGVGGIVGYAHDNTIIDDCSFNGTIHCTNGQHRFGGIVGNAALLHTNNCANYGTMDIHENYDAIVGGIYGSVDNADNTMTNCINVGAITQNGGFISSLIGLIYSISAESENNYWLEGTSDVGAHGDVNATCVTAAEMASGAITYALNEGQEATHWFQTLGEDAYPMLDATHGIVEKNGDDYTNGIFSILSNDKSENIYDLQGRRVIRMKKGLYIVNGKKIMVNK